MPLPVACIVEGHGDVLALPILVRRLAALINPAVYIDVQRPDRHSKSKLLRAGGIEDAVDLAIRGLPELGAVLIVIDSDDDCPKETAPQLLARAERKAAKRRHVSLVLANREFESWFIAAAESIKPGLAAPDNPESIRGAKEWLSKNAFSYSPTIDQPSLASQFDLDAARRHAPSFDKLYREIEHFCHLAAAT